MKTTQEQIDIIDWENLSLEDQQTKLDEIKKTVNRNSKWSDILLCLNVEKCIVEDEYTRPFDSFRWIGKELMEDVEDERILSKGIKANLSRTASDKTLILQTELRFGSEPSGIFATIEL